MRNDSLTQGDLELLLERTGAVRRGHFILSSGLHSPLYVQCALLLEDPKVARRVARSLARRLAPLRPVSVLAPALGGVIVGHEVAEALGVPFRFTERENGEMKLRRGFELRPGERVVVVEDAVTTGKSTRETIAVAEAFGAEPVAVGSIIDRSPTGKPFEVPFFSLLRLEIPTFDPESGESRPDWWGVPEKPGSRTLSLK